jgi:hypothetical protein
MSFILEVKQKPLQITPTNTNHIFNVQSTAYTQTNFQFIVDVYFKGDLVDWTAVTTNNRACRLKAIPNTYGNAIVDLEEIVRTFLTANPRFTGSTYPYLNYASEVNKVVTLADGQQTIEYNGSNLWAGGSPNASVDQLWHISEYKAVFGYSYTSGSSTVEVVDFNSIWNPSPITIFPGADNKLIPAPYLSGASIDSQGANWFAQENKNHLYYDLFKYMYQSGKTFTDWSCENNIVDCGPSQFLNAGGTYEYNIISQSDVVDTRVRRRKHHPDCPIIISFLNGKNDYFTNDIYSLAIRGALTHSDPYTYSAETANRTTTTLPVTNEPTNSVFKMGVFYLPYNVTSGNTLNAIPTNSKKVCFYGTTYRPSQNSRLSFSSRTTEILEFYMQDRSCVNNPIHLLFLNERGMWDTYTLAGKSSESYQINRPQYRQEISLNKAYYNVGSYQRGDRIYEQELDKTWECESWYMTQNDTEIMKEILFSPEVYIIDGTVIEDISCQSCLEEIRLYQYLIPVVIQDKSFKVFQKQYQKLFQYKLTLKYAGFKRLRTQG